MTAPSPAGPDPLVSVVLPVYNGRRFVKEAIRSALDQMYRPLEIVVIDDGSDEAIEPFLLEFADVLVVHRTANRGVAAARNLGIRLSHGALIGLLDQDDLWLPGKLQRQVEYLRMRPDVALVHTDTRYRDEVANRDFARRRPREAYVGRCHDLLFQGNVIATGTVLFRRKAAESIGGFDESIRGMDDYDFFLRLSRDHMLGYVDEPLAVYRFHEQNWSRRKRDMLLNELRVIEKAADTTMPPGSKITRADVVARLAGLLKYIGYSYFTAGEFLTARPFLKRSLGYRFDTAVGVWWAATGLSPGIVESLRSLKHRLGASKE